MSDAQLTHDAFLGGALHLWQPRAGFRASTDAVLLAACVPAMPGQRALDLGCGVGTAGLCLAHRTGAYVTGVEVDAETVALARRNGVETGLPFEVVEGDVSDLPKDLTAQSFDHVLCNPPYYPQNGGTSAQIVSRERAMREKMPLRLWLDAATRRVKPGGTVSFILLAERLPDFIAALDARLGHVRVLPLTPRAGRAAKRVIIQARKGAQTPFQLLAPFILHAGDRHERDAPSETDEARAILRDGAALPL